ncbi:VWA domain-containing protein, partial [Paenibacillus puldeungensis]
MGVRFDHPWFLLLLLPLAAGVIYAYRADFRLSGIRRQLAIGLRTAILVLLVALLSGLQTYTLVKDKEVVFLTDRSASMPELGPVQDWILKAGEGKGAEDRVGIVAAGLDAAVDKNLDPRLISDESLKAEVHADFTNLERGLELSGSLFSGQGNRRIILISDGEENVGEAIKAANTLKERGIAVDVLPVPGKERKDASVEDFQVPGKLYQAESFAFEVLIRSTFSGNAELGLFEDNREISRQKVTLERGDNRFTLQGLAQRQGMHRYRAEVFADGDEQSGNNANYAFTRVTGSPKVLIVEGKSGTSANLENALKSGLVDYMVIGPGMLPSEMTKYAAYDSIIFNNVSADQVGGKTMNLIEQAVRSYGIGFVMVGGEDSYGMGGYFKTPIEKLLPVSMELEGKRQIPSLGLILVIDRSGSMDGEKLNLAKEAAQRTVELLRSQDTVGVVAFDDQPWWVVEPQKLGDKKDVLTQINSIPSGGGTNIYPAVEGALNKILSVSSQRKHLILLTDGQSAVNNGYDALLETMNQSKITMSTVAVGEDADTKLLQSLAQGAKGRYYPVTDATTLPAIFSREAAMVARTYIVDKPFVPALVSPGDWGKWFSGGVPKIYGYVAATPKSTAQTVLASPEPDPLLARWQYGSGRSVAWTSDLTGKWSRDWVSWPSYAGLFTEMVKWTFPQFSASPFEVNTTIRGNEIQFEVTAEGEAPPEELEAAISGEDLREEKVPLVQSSPGVYKGTMLADEPGSFLIHLQGKSGGKMIDGGTGTGLVIPYSPEYRLLNDEPLEKLQKIAEMTGGRVLDWNKPEAAFHFAAKSYPSPHDLERPLLIAALLLWLADIAIRRLALPWGRMAERLAAAMPWRRRARARSA